MRKEKKATIRVVTYNVHFGEDTESIIRLFRTNKNLAKADVILFQEIEDHFAEVLPRARSIAEALRFHFFYAASRSEDLNTHGIATLSKFPIIKNTTLKLPKYVITYRHQQRIALLSNIQVGKKDITLTNIHLDARLNARDRIIQLDHAITKVRELFGQDIILGGDFNTLPFFLLGKLFPIGFQNQGERVHNYLVTKFFVNSAGRSVPTFSKMGLRMRLDHIYTDNLPIVAWGIEDDKGISDHFPLWADIEI